MAWTRGYQIGKGSTAAVSTAVRGREILAVKTSEFSKSHFLQREKEILSNLTSPYVVGYKGYDVSKERNELYYNLFLEYVSGGSLADEIRRRDGLLDEQSIRSYTCQILRGVEYLHSNGITHCDIKCSNILITEQNEIKLADFGSSKTAARSSGNTSTVSSNDAVSVSGTPIYMAPETARGEVQSYEADVWAIGCSVIEMATGGLPWTDSGSDPVRVLYRIGFSDQVPAFPTSFSAQGKDFLSKCLVRDPKERWTVKELLNHSFVKKIESFEKPNSISPNCVLDRQLWSCNSDDEDESPSSSETDERMEGMAGVCGRPNWSWEGEGWIRVRSESDGSSCSISEIECFVEDGEDVELGRLLRCGYDCGFSSSDLGLILMDY